MARIWRKKVGLALGGGGARGVSHIGVLQVLEDAQIPIDVIVGTSIGALVGGAYASGTSPTELAEKVETFIASREFQSSVLKSVEAAFAAEEESFLKKVRSFLKSQFFLIQMLLRPSILSASQLESLIDYFIPEMNIEDCRLPFRAVAADLKSGEPFVFSSGSLRRAILASSAVPGAIEPIDYDGKLLSDGGIVSPVPVETARKEGAQVVIAVPVDRSLPTQEEFKTAKDIFYQASEITCRIVERHELEQADIIIRPNVKDLHWSNFSRALDLIKEGEKAAKESLPEIKTRLSLVSSIIYGLKRLGGKHHGG
ncbi:MAG TPA: patatin-like phospholipase family protein [Syntrophales bacterium]|nr:patatin-like phospholipase family protein [Syntrophales bacterium]HOL58823.1 patatin-like phospholipase family protein [Syntrophales bacterium]HPO35150.1 patatin-like phospholipase family protein [Syntrophales bacterium]